MSLTYDDIKKIGASMDVEKMLADCSKEELIIKYKAAVHLLNIWGIRFEISPEELIASLIEIESELMIVEESKNIKQNEIN